MLSLIRELLVSLIDKIDNGGCNDLKESEYTEIISLLKQYTDLDRRISKYEACQFLGISRATFDNYVREGKIPRGKKEVGYKELSWKKKDLVKIKNS